MAKQELTIQYRVKPQKILFTLMCFAFPIWAIAVPALLGLFIGHAIIMGSLPLVVSVFTCTALLMIVVLSLLICGVSEDNRIHVSKNGVSFPLYMLPRLDYRRNRDWKDLKTIDLAGSGDQQRLLIGFATGGMVGLGAEAIDPGDLEQMLVSIELWAPDCERTALLEDYQRELQNRSTGVKSIGYTRMWEEELGRRFSATRFIPLEPDQELQNGRIKIVKQLAFGGLSAIYLAQVGGVDLVVIKEAVVPPDADREQREAAASMLEKEATVLAGLDHPSIARVLDHFVEDDRHYLVVQYINGQDLRQYVKQNGALDQATTIEWARQIASIMMHLHNQDPPVIHRDLTPDNLVLTSDGDIVLIDFGAANLFVGEATGTIVGKQAYIPPEQLRGKAVPQSDIYSFGGTLYFLLTGEDPLALMPCDAKKKVTEIDEELNKVILKCSAFDTTGRYQQAGHILEDLAELTLQHAGRMTRTPGGAE